LVGTDLGGRAVRLVGVRMEGLTPIETRQLTLEEAVADSGTARRRAEGAMDEVRSRFGRSAVLPGALIVPAATQLPSSPAGNYPEGQP